MPASCGTRSLVSQSALSGVFKLHFYGIVKLVFVTLFCAIFRVMFSSIELVLGISMSESCPAILGHIMRQALFTFHFLTVSLVGPSTATIAVAESRALAKQPSPALLSTRFHFCLPTKLQMKIRKVNFLIKSYFYFLSYQEEEKNRFRLVKLHDK